MKVPIGHVEIWQGNPNEIPEGWEMIEYIPTYDLNGNRKDASTKSLKIDEVPAWVFDDNGKPIMFPIRKIKELDNENKGE